MMKTDDPVQFAPGLYLHRLHGLLDAQRLTADGQNVVCREVIGGTKRIYPGREWDNPSDLIPVMRATDECAEFKDKPASKGDVVQLRWVKDRDGTARRLTGIEAQALNAGLLPSCWAARSSPLPHVRRLRAASHFYTTCSAARQTRGSIAVARSLPDTTCHHCLMTRAYALRGVRWTFWQNRVEVEYLKSMLGSRVDGFGLGPASPGAEILEDAVTLWEDQLRDPEEVRKIIAYLDTIVAERSK